MSIKCCAEGCDRDAMYAIKRLCQKHYFRVMRGGTTELRRTARVYRRTHTAGYQLIYEPAHPLASKFGYVYEHRFVIYGVYGPDLPPCEICGKIVSWADCHIDHIDNDVTNNTRQNLRQTCGPCNVRRGVRTAECEYSGNSKITIDGVSMTASEWARQPGVNVCGATILRRKAGGASDYDAVHAPKITHNGKGNRRMKKERESANG